MSRIVRFEGPRARGQRTAKAVERVATDAGDGVPVWIITDGDRRGIRRKLRELRVEERVAVDSIPDDTPIPETMWRRIEAFDGLVVLDGTYGP